MDQKTQRFLRTSELRFGTEQEHIWLLAIKFMDWEQPSLYRIDGGNTDKLIATLAAARDRWAR